MKRVLFLLGLLLSFAACNDDTGSTEPEPVIEACSSSELTYPDSVGTSGDSINGLLGYGYDVAGFCDTISVKAKVFQTIPNAQLDGASYCFPTLISGSSFDKLVTMIQRVYNGSTEALTHHVASLMKLANLSDSINSNMAYTYYSSTGFNSHNYFIPRYTDQNILCVDFKRDVATLSPEAIVSKYGTHVIVNYYSGYKLEVLYRCKLATALERNVFEFLFYNRMKEFFGGTPGIYMKNVEQVEIKKSDEVMIYNSFGSRMKKCGVVTISDYNPDSVSVNLNSLFNKENAHAQFVEIAQNGISPIYMFIADEAKKEEVRIYIENYMTKKMIY